MSGCGSSDEPKAGEPLKDAHDPKVLRYMERQVKRDLNRQLDSGRVRRVDCADTGDRGARCIATDTQGSHYGIDVHVSSDGSFLSEVRP